MSKAQAKRQYTSGRIAPGGCGGFLNPPTHPEHFWHVETDLRRRPENRGVASLTYAAEKCTWLDPAVRREARGILAAWEPPPADDPAIIDWRHQVLGYYRGMYRTPGVDPAKQWHVSELTHSPDSDPIQCADDHAGVHCIRKFYADYVPTPDDFSERVLGPEPEPGTDKDGAS